MSDSTVYLVTYNDGDYYTRYPETLAVFTSRDDAASYALGIVAREVELFGEVEEGYELVTMTGDEVASRLSVMPLLGVGRDEYNDIRVTDRDAVYSSLECILFS